MTTRVSYVIEYWLPHQSHLFSDPQRIVVHNLSKLREIIEEIKKNNYEITRGYAYKNALYLYELYHN